MQTISYEKIINMYTPYDPLEIGMPIDYEDTICNFIDEYRGKFKNPEDIFYILLRKEHFTHEGLFRFAIWCARRVEDLIKDQIDINVINIAEKYLDEKVDKTALSNVIKNIKIANIKIYKHVTYNNHYNSYKAYAIRSFDGIESIIMTDTDKIINNIKNSSNYAIKAIKTYAALLAKADCIHGSIVSLWPVEAEKAANIARNILHKLEVNAQIDYLYGLFKNKESKTN